MKGSTYSEMSIVHRKAICSVLATLCLALGLIGLTGCRSTPSPTPQVEATVPPPDLEARPWGLTHDLLDSLSTGATSGLDQMLSPHALELRTQSGREALAEATRGLRPAKEELLGRRARVWLSSPVAEESSSVALRFELHTGRWHLIEAEIGQRTLR